VPFFKMSGDKRLYFTDRSRKHNGEAVDEVARVDPKYVQWARRERMGGLPPECFDVMDDIMRTNGVPFTNKKKPSPRRKS
jgi:hypothetical protein